MQFKVNVDRELCKSCGICVSICGRSAIKMNRGLPELVGECVGCRLCEFYCPDFAISVEVVE